MRDRPGSQTGSGTVIGCWGEGEGQSFGRSAFLIGVRQSRSEERRKGENLREVDYLNTWKVEVLAKQLCIA